MSLTMMLIRTLALQLCLWTPASAADCLSEVDATGYHKMKSDMLVIDVRTWGEYIGDGSCDAGATTKKCHMGHVTEAYFLKNDARTDKASVYKVGSEWILDQKLVDALAACYGNQTQTLKIGFNCFSGYRSNLMQEQLVKAGFKCANIYNIQGGNRDLYALWEASNFTNDTLKFVKGEGSPGVFDWTTCPTDKSGPTTAAPTAAPTPAPTAAPTPAPTPVPEPAAECASEVDATGYHKMKSDMLVIDVRTWGEYIGDASCDDKTPKKCHMGHVPEAYFLKNEGRDDKASVYKVGSEWILDQTLVDALARCYGDQASTQKIGFNCFSGFRSNLMQEQLVKAGFKCANIYNIQGGNRDLYALWEASKFKDDNLKFIKGEGSPGVFDWATCPTDKSGPKAASPSAAPEPAPAGSSTDASGAYSLQILSSLAVAFTAATMFV